MRTMFCVIWPNPGLLTNIAGWSAPLEAKHKDEANNAARM